MLRYTVARRLCTPAARVALGHRHYHPMQRYPVSGCFLHTSRALRMEATLLTASPDIPASTAAAATNLPAHSAPATPAAATNADKKQAASNDVTEVDASNSNRKHGKQRTTSTFTTTTTDGDTTASPTSTVDLVKKYAGAAAAVLTCISFVLAPMYLLNNKLDSKLDKLSEQMVNMRDDVNKQIAGLRVDLKEQVGSLRMEMRDMMTAEYHRTDQTFKRK